MARRSAVAEALTALRFIWTHPANRHRRVAKVAQALAFQIKGRAFGRPSVARIGERSRMIVHPGLGQAGLLYANPTEWPEILCWRRTLRPADLFVDVGANVGAYTLWAIELGADVIAIEPNGWAVEQLEANLALNGYRAEVVRAAAMDAAGTARITTDLGVLNHVVTEGSDATIEQVAAVTIDDIVGERAVAGLKIDVEGAEMSVLRGAERALTEHRIRLIQLEWNTYSSERFGIPRAAIAEYLTSLGYEMLRPDMRGVLQPLASWEPGPDVFARVPV